MRYTPIPPRILAALLSLVLSLPNLAYDRGGQALAAGNGAASSSRSHALRAENSQEAGGEAKLQRAFTPAPSSASPATGLEETELEANLRRPEVSGGNAVRWRWLTGDGPTYDAFVRDYFPGVLVKELVQGLSALYARAETESGGQGWTAADAGGGFGFALKEALAGGKYPGMRAVLADAVAWKSKDVASQARHLLLEGRARGVGNPFAENDFQGRWHFRRGDVSRLELKEPGQPPLRVITALNVMGFSPDPLGMLVHLYNQLEPGEGQPAFLLANVAIPAQYGDADSLVAFYRDRVIQALRRLGVRVDWKLTDVRTTGAPAQGLKAGAQEFQLGLVLIKSADSPRRITLLAQPNAEPFTTFRPAQWTVEYQAVRYETKAGIFASEGPAVPLTLEQEIQGIVDQYATGTQLLVLETPPFLTAVNLEYGRFLAMLTDRLAGRGLRQIYVDLPPAVLETLSSLIQAWRSSGVSDFMTFVREYRPDSDEAASFVSRVLPSHLVPVLRVAQERGLPVRGLEPGGFHDIEGLPAGGVMSAGSVGNRRRMALRILEDRRAGVNGPALVLVNSQRQSRLEEILPAEVRAAGFQVEWGEAQKQEVRAAETAVAAQSRGGLAAGSVEQVAQFLRDQGVTTLDLRDGEGISSLAYRTAPALEQVPDAPVPPAPTRTLYDLFPGLMREIFGEPAALRHRYGVVLSDGDSAGQVHAYVFVQPELSRQPANRRFGSLDKFLNQYGDILKREGFQADVEALQKDTLPKQVWVVRSRIPVHPTVVMTYVDSGPDEDADLWQTEVAKRLQKNEDRMNNVLFTVRPYPEDGVLAAPPAVVIRARGARPVPETPAAAPVIILDGVKDVQLLTPAQVYAVSLWLLDSQVVGPVLKVLTFKDEQGETIHAIFV